MQGYKLFRMIQVLQAEELSDADRFLHADYHNTHEPSRRLFRYLIRFWPDMDAPQLSREQLFRKAYGKEPYRDLKLRKLMSRLTRLLEQYLVQRRMASDSKEYKQQLAAALASRQDYGLFLSEVQDQLSELEDQPERGEAYLSRVFQLYRQIYYHPNYKQYQSEQPYFQHFVQAFEAHFTLQTLTFGIESKILSRLAGHQNVQSLLNAVLSLPNAHPLLAQPVIAFFLKMYLLLSSTDQAPDIASLRELLDQHTARMSMLEKKMAFKVMINYMTPFSNSGNLDHSVFLFELYRGGIDLGLLDENQSFVAANFFLNVTTIALTAKAFDWTEKFLERYGPLLPPGEQEVTLLYGRAYWHYAYGVVTRNEKELSHARYLLQTIPVRSDELLNTRVRTLEIRVMYDQLAAGDLILDEIMSAIANFRRHLVGRSAMTDANIRRYLRFIGHLRKLARLSKALHVQVDDLLKLQAEIQQDNLSFFRTWLAEKVRSLIPADFLPPPAEE
ncbi:MAG: hypothetical protein RLY31_1712 [Bacteroidota bacterium]